MEELSFHRRNEADNNSPAFPIAIIAKKKIERVTEEERGIFATRNK